MATTCNSHNNPHKNRMMSETKMGLSHFPKSTKSAVYMRHFAWLLCGVKGNITHYYVNHENFD